MQKLLIVTAVIPYPLTGGGRISQFATLEKLVNYINVELLVEAFTESQLTAIEELKIRLPNLNVSYVSSINKPKSKPTKRSRSIKQILKSIYNKLKQHPVTKNTISSKSDPYEEVNRLNYIFANLNPRFIDKLHQRIHEFDPDIVQVEHNRYITLGALISKYKPTVFIDHEIQFARILSTLNSKGMEQDIYANYLLEKFKTQEISYLNNYNKVITFSEIDKIKLLSQLANEKPEAIPFPIMESDFNNTTISGRIKKLVFIGGSNHYPNKEGVEWMLNHINDNQLRKLDVKLYITGTWDADFVLQYTNREEVIFSGFIDDLNSFCTESLMLVPIRIGSGIRTKILYAMARKIPVLSTTLGFEGINLKQGKDIIIENNIDSWNMHIEDLIKHPEKVIDISQNAYNVALNFYSQKSVVEQRLLLYKKLVDNA